MGIHDEIVEIMFQINKLTDYAVHVLSALRDANDTCQSATLISQATSVPVTTVSKCLKLLALASLVESTRGPKGGYRLSQPLSQVSLLNVMEAIEGKMAVTQCVQDDGCCDKESHCGFRSNWQQVNQRMSDVLATTSVADMISPVPRHSVSLSSLITSRQTTLPQQEQGYESF